MNMEWNEPRHMQLAPNGIDFTTQNATSDGATRGDTGEAIAEGKISLGKEQTKNTANSQNN